MLEITKCLTRNFTEIHERYRRPILKYVFQRVKDREVAQEIVQEIFLKAFRFRASYRPQYALSTWLWTIAKNTVSDWHRKHEDERSSETCLLEPVSAEPDAESLFEEASRKKALAVCLGKLTDLQKKVIVLRVIHQLSYAEISRNLGMSISAVKCLAYRSKQALSQMGYSPAFA